MRTKLYRKLAAAACALALLLGLMPAARAADRPAPSAAVTMASSFSDVGANHWAKSWIDRCVELNIVQGYTDGTFGPDNPVTGAQFATMLSRLFFSSQLEANSAASSGIWYLPAMRTANDAGLLAGTSNLAGGASSSWSGSADRNLNRYDMAQMIYNTASALGKTPDESALTQARTAVSDFSQIPGGYQTAVSSCIALGAITGMDNGTFSGSGNMTRAQACTVICRVLDAVGGPGSAADPNAPTITIAPTALTLEVGKTDSVKATVTGSTAAVTYHSYGDDVATVDANGTVTGVAPGSVSIDASITVGGKTYRAFCTVTVKESGDTVETLTFSDSYKSSKYYTALQAVQLTGDYRVDIMNIAASQIGYCESNDKEQLDGSHPGTGDCTEYGRALGSNGSAWCSEFASWCIRQAKVPLGLIKSSKSANVSTFDAPYYNWSQTVFAGGSYTPQPGDLVLFANNGTSPTASNLSHTGIVTGFSQQGDKVILYTIEGNYNNSVQRGERTLTASGGKYSNGVVGYFVAPNYGPSSVVPYSPEGQQAASLKFAAESLSLEAGKTGTVTATLSGGTATVSYTSGTPAVATVDANGTVTALKEGTAVITASASVNGKTVTAVCTVTVKAAESTAGSSLEDYCAEVIRLVNEERAKEGLAPLETFDTLTKAAGIRAPELITLFDHTRPNGSKCFTALSEAGVTGYYTAGENIAAGQSTPAAVMNSWMNSSGHRANILNQNFTHIGVGCVKSGYSYYWVQMFVGTNNVPGGSSSSSSPATLAMSAETLELEAGTTGTVKATLSGGTAKISYTSSALAVATVDANGTVTARKAGTAVITASASVNGKTVTATCTVTVKEAAAVSAADYCDEVVRLVNEERAKAGLAPLETFDTLTKAAGIRASELGTLFDHTRPNGSQCFTALGEAGVTGYYTAGENIASGQSSPAAAMNSWMNSSGHRANILNKNFTHIGVGCVKSGYGYYWVQMFVGTNNAPGGSSSSNPGSSTTDPGNSTDPGNNTTTPGSTTDPGTTPTNSNPSSNRLTTTYVPENGRVTYYRESWGDGNFQQIEVNGNTVTYSGCRNDLKNPPYTYAVLKGFGAVVDDTPFIQGQTFSVSIEIDVDGLTRLYGGDTSKANSFLSGGLCQNYTPGDRGTAGIGFFRGVSSVALALNANGGLELQLYRS